MIEPLNKKLSLSRQLKCLSLNRSSYYYQKCPYSELNEQLMKEIDRIHLERPYYGYRRITCELKRKGYAVNQKRVHRLMRTMNIQTIYQAPRTSIPNHSHKKYPYLLKKKVIDQPDQAWATDITYIPMKQGFLYLTVIQDWYSRAVLSWKLSNTMDTDFCVRSLQEALGKGVRPQIHNSDQGSQYTSEGYTKILEEHGIAISMDGKGRYMDNLFVERFWRSLKYEEVYLHAYESIREARKQIETYMQFYNENRPHQALGYRTPMEVYHSNKIICRNDMQPAWMNEAGARPPRGPCPLHETAWT